MNSPASLVRIIVLTFVLLGGIVRGDAAPAAPRMVGVAKVDITPDYPIRLSGYGNRREESEGMEQHIWAKALAIGADAEEPAVLITVDNCGVPVWMRDEVAARLAKGTKVSPEHLSISFSHTHCAPCLKDALPNIFSMDVPPEHQERIDRYSRELTDKLEQVARAALADRKPAVLSWAEGTATFARNRRGQGGPVDFALPVLFVHAPDGTLRGVFASYACHATTLQLNRIHGDWPGTAMAAIERDHPGAIALVALGCGADQNPNPRGTLELAAQHGESVAAEVERLLAGPRRSIAGKLVCRTKEIALAYEPLPTRDEWLKLAQDKRPQIAFHARKNLARLDRGEKLPTELPYKVATWTFGDDLTMVFLPGEVTVDYGLRLKNELDGKRLWVNGYSNAAPCYIPSRRVLEEGGYEGGFAMVYYDRPTRFAADVEERIVGAVHELVPKSFEAKAMPGYPLAKSPTQSWSDIQVKPGFTVDLAAAEPLIVDPVAIEWGADGRLWVVEMRDYPMGSDGNWKPGGDIKVLEDTDGDGRYDKATVFLDGLPFPTGVLPWRKGVLVCAAPDILYAEDSNGDGRADVVKKLFTGFDGSNYQARVNSLALGLDNWIHGANGLLGGTIRGMSNASEVDIRGRDFRFNPDTLVFEAASGVTQQGRCRDDWDNWFGCSNGNFLFQFPLPESYVRRNPHVPAPPSRLLSTMDADPSRVFPISQPLDRFNAPESLNHVTSGCGLGMYRDTLLGEAVYGSAFSCEPVHNLVHRSTLTLKGTVFEGHRAPDEQESEFLASKDNWFRPVQARTGPDGALWVVDMYRAVIEHPRWIPADKLAQLDVRAGADKGRLYRVYPTGAKLRPVKNLTKLATPELVAALETPNGTTRDLVHLELLQRADQTAAPALAALVQSSKTAAVRVQALCTLDALRAATPELLQQALGDLDPWVRRHAVRISEAQWTAHPTLALDCIKLASDPDARVRYQLALSLGNSTAPQVADALATIAEADSEDPWIRAAVISSCTKNAPDVLRVLLSHADAGSGKNEVLDGLIRTAAATATGMNDLGQLLVAIAQSKASEPQPWQITGLLRLQDAFDRRKIAVNTLAEAGDATIKAAAEQSRGLFDTVHRIAPDPNRDLAVRTAAVRLFGRGFNSAEQDIPLLIPFLAVGTEPELQKAALETLARSRDPRVPGLVLSDWKRHGPATRTAILNMLLTRADWMKPLLDQIEAGTIPATDIPTDVRQRLGKIDDKAIQARTAALFPARAETRSAVVSKYHVVATLKGDPLRGATFYQNICSVCHAYLGQGHEVGPNITTFRTKSVEEFIIAILDPNAVVEPRYAAYTVELKDGRQLTGVIASETATTLVLSQAGGAKESLLRSEIATLRATNQSLMPEGLDQALTPQDLADLIAYLKGAG